MTHEDLTIVDVLKDPLIRLMMRADHVSVKTMKALLVYAAQKQGVGLGNRKHQHVAKKLFCEGSSRYASALGGYGCAFDGPVFRE
ncbi:hypothetical protein ACEQ6A_15055 [Rhizobium brockwellii]|uniref:hypothetical protein n=1 Tax=Rhizobium brockwellii TaxID=3019932 RepID=UPI003F957179